MTSECQESCDRHLSGKTHSGHVCTRLCNITRKTFAGRSSSPPPSPPDREDRPMMCAPTQRIDAIFLKDNSRAFRCNVLLPAIKFYLSHDGANESAGKRFLISFSFIRAEHKLRQSESVFQDVSQERRRRTPSRRDFINMEKIYKFSI